MPRTGDLLAFMQAFTCSEAMLEDEYWPAEMQETVAYRRVGPLKARDLQGRCPSRVLHQVLGSGPFLFYFILA